VIILSHVHVLARYERSVGDGIKDDDDDPSLLFVGR
jgi:hypothetical protein